eukprot:tig00000189_g14328.t1
MGRLRAENLSSKFATVSPLWSAALCIDLDHPGVSAEYLYQSQSTISTLYCHRSPLEHHHGARALALLQQKGCAITGAVDPIQRRALHAVPDGYTETDESDGGLASMQVALLSHGALPAFESAKALLCSPVMEIPLAAVRRNLDAWTVLREAQLKG